MTELPRISDFIPLVLGHYQGCLSQALLKRDWLLKRLNRARALAPSGVVPYEEVEELDYLWQSEDLRVTGLTHLLELIRKQFP